MLRLNIFVIGKENIIPRLVGFIHIKNQQIQTGVELS